MVGSALNTADHALKKTIISSPAIDTQTHSSLVNAIMHVESRFNDSAIGDNGKAIGCLQIHPVLVREVNRLQEVEYTLEDRWDRKKSIEMFNIILKNYKISKAKSFMDSAEIISRRWNGGPKGDNKKCTEKYWEKVKEKL
jgi:soluble lytic murein transglycosylase-like protein